MRATIRAVSLVLALAATSFVWAGEKAVGPEAFDHRRESYLMPDAAGNLWAAYYDTQGKIHATNVSEGKDLIVYQGYKDSAAGLAFDIQGDHLFFLWREKKEGRKKLWFRASHDGGKTLSEPVLIDEATAALTRIKVGANAKGEVYVLWYGERTGDASHWHIYVRASDDFGKTFSEAKNLTSGYASSIYPTLFVDEEGASSFSYSSNLKQDKRFMVFRKTTDGGKTWTEPLEITETGVVTLHVAPMKVGKRLHVFWFNQRKGEEAVIEGAYSDDGGKTWKTTVLEETRGLSVGSLKSAQDTKGHIYLAFYGTEQGKKARSYVITSPDNGATWSGRTEIRHYPFEKTSVRSPSIAATETGEVVVVWVDYRNIRANLYMQYSRDFGKTWQERDIPLEEPGRFNTRHNRLINNLVVLKDRCYDLAIRFKDDALEESNLLLIDFDLNTRSGQ